MQTQSSLTEQDFDLFFRLSSAYHALTLSASDPVAMVSDLVQGAGRIRNLIHPAFARQFYDTMDDEEAAIAEMRRRIVSGYDISRHLKIHDGIKESFYSIEEALNANNRGRIHGATLSLTNGIQEYTNLVAAHAQKLGSEAFLSYPVCVPGHYFMVEGTSDIRENIFNPEGTRSGIMDEIDGIRSSLISFSHGTESLFGFKLTDLEDHGEGIFDTSLRGRIELTRELLRRVGYLERDESN